jgi:cell division protein FtsA
MAKSRYHVGLDIGSSNVRAVIAQELAADELLRVVGVGMASSVGIRRGTVVDVEAVAKTCNAVLEEAERMSGQAVSDVTVNVTGVELGCQRASGVVAVGRADGEVTEDDISRALEEVQARLMLPLNREVVHVIPMSYRLDDQKDIKDPIGMHGVRLEMSAFVVSGSTSHLKNLSRALEQAGTHPESFVAEPLACAEAVLHQKQKELGTVIIDIGGSTTSLAVFEDGDLLHLAVLPIGGGHITNDIAIGLRTSIEVAEAVKLRYGSALPDGIGKREEIDLSLFDSQEEGIVSRHHVAEVIEARLEEIFTLVNAELKSIGREGLLPGGAVLTGGGALLPGTVDLAKDVLRLPSHIGYPQALGGILDQVDNPQFSTVIGLLLSARANGSERGSFSSQRMWNHMPEGVQEVTEKMKGWCRRFLP